jgi:Flp pilus assembly protein TadG
MIALLRQFWSDQRGYAGMEWALVTTILVLGAITAAVAARQVSPNANEPAVAIHR